MEIFSPKIFKIRPPQLLASCFLLLLTETFLSIFYALDTAWGWRIKGKYGILSALKELPLHPLSEV